MVYVLGVALLGLLDDALGHGAAADTPRGWRGHTRAVLSGRFSTGAIKAVGALALAAYAVSGRGRQGIDYVGDLALLLLATNLFNLLDLRPGRVEKAFALLLAGLCIGAWTVAAAGAARHLHRPGARRRGVHAARVGDARRHRLEPGRGARRDLDAGGARRHGSLDRPRAGRGAHDLRGVSVDLADDRIGSATALARLARQSEFTRCRTDEAGRDTLHLRHRRSRLLAGQGDRGVVDRPPAGQPRLPGAAAEVRPLHQHRPGDDEPVPARRGVRHRGRRRDRPRPRPLRALHRREHLAVLERHRRRGLQLGDPARAARRLPRRHRAGDPAHHRRDQAADPDRRRVAGGRLRDHRDRRHGRRHRVAAVPRGDPPALLGARPEALHVPAPDAGPLHRPRGRAEDEADPAFGQRAAPDRDPAARAHLPLREGARPRDPARRSRSSPRSTRTPCSRRATSTTSTRCRW